MNMCNARGDVTMYWPKQHHWRFDPETVPLCNEADWLPGWTDLHIGELFNSGAVHFYFVRCQSVILFSKLNWMFMGYFDPVNIIFDCEN